MKKVKLIFGALFIASFMLTSCGGSSNDKDGFEIPDAPTDIKYSGVVDIDGPLAGYVEVVPGDYKFELTKRGGIYPNYEGTMKVKLRFIESLDVKAGSGYNSYGPSLLGKALDEDGIPLEFNLNATADKDLATYLARGSGEEWITLRLSAQGSPDNTEEAVAMLDKFKKGKQIRFNSEIVEEKFDSGSSSASSSSSSSGSDCDKFLKGYEKFMDKYIAILKKQQANPTDMSIMSEYSEAMSEASEWTDKLSDDCANDPSFMAKYTEIQMKIANAAGGM